MIEALATGQHLLNAGGNGELQRMNNIVLVIPGIAENNPLDEVSLALQTFSIPNIFGTSNPVTVQKGITPRKYAGNLSYDALSVTFHDVVDRPALTQFLKWRAQATNYATQQVRAASSYKKNGRAILIGPEGTRNREILIFGMWCSGVVMGEADKGSDEPLLPSATIEYDYALPGEGFDANSFLGQAALNFAAGQLTQVANNSLF